MSEPERLQLGRRPGSGDADGSDADTFRARWKRRRAAKKRRIAAMSRRRRIARRVGILATWFLGLIAAIMVAAIILFYSLSDVPRPEDVALPQVATILYADGSVMGRFGTVDHTDVPLRQVPPPVRWDVIAAEDRGFYNEPGISVTGTLRAAVNDLTGGDTQGGSGITQQYVKNAYLNSSQTLTRKLKELAIAVKLSREYSKDQILEFYLNTVYFGRGAYGIQAAAHAYFREDVSKLNVAQGAVLAALLRAPSYYDPAVNPGEAQDRWKYVLSGMVDIHKLTQARVDGLKYPKVAPVPKNTGLTIGGPNAIIVARVIDELAAQGIPENEIYAKGLTIKTTINRRAQADAVSAIHQTFSGLTRQQRNMKNALVAVRPKDGAVLAYYGGPYGKNYAHKKDQYDYAGLGSAAPGSSFKPYTLATALTQTLDKKAKGDPITIGSVVDGSYCVHIEGTKICNDPSDQPYSSSHIRVSLAMKYSLNTTFDQMAQHVGPSNVADTAHAAGISKTINGKPSLQNADGHTTFGIGIGDYPVHPIDQAVGFATFANNGQANAPYFVQEAKAADGEVIYSHHNHSSQAFDPKVANDTTLTLEPIAGWSGVPLADGRPSAAKTGTEGIQVGKHAGGNSDAWMVGFTPQVSTAVWVGSGNSTKPIVSASGAPEYGRDLPGRTWQLFMDKWLAGKAAQPLPTKQLIGAPTPTRTVEPTTEAAPSTHPPTQPSTTATSSSSTPTPTPTTTKPTPTPTTLTPTRPPTCSPGLILPNCATSPSASPSSPPRSSAGRSTHAAGPSTPAAG
ncbi:MAG TPA: transglycosylase domain-containing protein [Jatrophihabitans sp.]